MSRGKRKPGGPSREQFSISAAVSEAEKRRVTEEAENRGCSESELVLNGVFGQITPFHPLTPNARDHLAACHAVLSSKCAGENLRQSDIDELIRLARELLREVREHS